MSVPFIIVCLILILAKWGIQIWLEQLNQRHVRAHANEIPAAFTSTITPENYAKSVDYTLTKSRFEKIELTWNLIVLLAVLFSGLLPRFYQTFQQTFGHTIWAESAFLIVVAILLTIPDLPLDWHSQFRIEERFGFNTTTPGLWWMDRVKGLLLTVLIGYPLLALILKIVEKLGTTWWLWAWVCMVAVQLLMMVIGPILILPLFNKFSPLPVGPLRDRLLALGERTGFLAKDIQVMDGSKRSRHSNAFFTGFGKFRKIVLFDTLITQLEPSELEAVLAHEIGHNKKGHIPKTIFLSMLGMLLGFFALAVLAKQNWFYASFGFPPGSIVPAFLLFGLLSGVVTFWLGPLFNRLSRKHEYEADAYAANIMREIKSLTGALRKLNEKNLSNLTPHPTYSGFYYSHPTLLERENALAQISLTS